MQTLLPPKRILIIKLQHHGDVLLATPVADALKQAYPDCEIDMLVYAATADVISDNLQLRRIFCIDRQWKKQGAGRHLHHEYALFRNLRAQHYDWVINLSGQWRAALAAKLCGRRSAGIGLGNRNNALWRWAHSSLAAELGHEHHIVAHHLAALDPLALPAGIVPKVRMDIADAHRNSLRAKLAERGRRDEDYVLMHPGSRWFFKCWDNDKTAALLQKLLDHGENIVLTAAPDEREQAMLEEIAGRLKTSATAKVWLLSGCLNLRELAAAIDEAKLFIGVDSVPMHMAAALDKPQVALFGPSWVSRWRPYSDQATVIWAGDYGPLPHPDSINTDDPTRLLSAIPVEAVWQAVAQKLYPKAV
ncbi:putative lipopolysaccharide heptosyltransferase III [Uruburuella testudinis]|uniref:Lipopolysaccharide heptosyltransferase III n=1 Tax=Uruburuella testudinis TaxID=1282863 RepID=A0ABY4DVP3_9NEIS|nr:putative lipopolysaccharide heptosyltransferase III [Uruburuella testudinis]UOO81657.1 putative lipopolysaccharide heptosyltransferase III [Uruburuella testudinis]